jgi:hypothetical protein
MKAAWARHCRSSTNRDTTRHHKATATHRRSTTNAAAGAHAKLTEGTLEAAQRVSGSSTAPDLAAVVCVTVRAPLRPPLAGQRRPGRRCQGAAMESAERR